MQARRGQGVRNRPRASSIELVTLLALEAVAQAGAATVEGGAGLAVAALAAPVAAAEVLVAARAVAVSQGVAEGLEAATEAALAAAWVERVAAEDMAASRTEQSWLLLR